MTGKLREAEVNIGVMGILFQIGGLCYMIPLGLQGTCLEQEIPASPTSVYLSAHPYCILLISPILQTCHGD